MNSLKALKVFTITAKYFKRTFDKCADITAIKREWSYEMAMLFNMSIQVKGAPANLNTACIFVGNHISYLDIPVLIHALPSLTFVSKKEIKKWPMIGIAAQKINTIFVERNNKTSKILARKKIADTLKENNQHVAIFPSGTTSILRSPSWKKGVFEIAKDHDIQILPFRIRYEPLNKVAYVGEDTFVWHLLELFKIPQINVYLEFNDPQVVMDVDHSCKSLKNWCESAF